LEPFARINPCGLLDTQVTQLKALTETEEHGAALLSQVQQRLQTALCDQYQLQLSC